METGNVGLARTEPSSEPGRLEVSVPEEVLTAGQDNLISFVLRNPFDSPVTVTEVVGPTSPSLRAEPKLRGSAPEPSGNGSLRRFAEPLVWGAMGAIKMGLPFSQVEIKLPTRANRTINVLAEPNSAIKFDQELGPYAELNVKAAEGSTIEIGQRTANSTSEPDVTIIPPRSERVFSVSIRTNHWVLFTPQRFPVNIQLAYSILGKERTQVVTASFAINPPLTSILIGSVIGGGLGASARALQSPADLNVSFLVQGVAAIVMSVIAAITLSRKSGAQSFITVEDFFGAFAVGALIGYGGSEYFRRAILPTSGVGSAVRQ